MFARLIIVALMLVAGCLCDLTTAAEIYKWTDEDGKVHFGDRPPPSVDDAEALAIDSDPQAVPLDPQRCTTPLAP